MDHFTNKNQASKTRHKHKADNLHIIIPSAVDEPFGEIQMTQRLVFMLDSEANIFNGVFFHKHHYSHPQKPRYI